jgi:hypothetical protein
MQVSHILELTLPGAVSSQAEQDDAQLVKASQRGDQDAFALLVQRHECFVFNLSLRMVQDYEDASEVNPGGVFGCLARAAIGQVMQIVPVGPADLALSGLPVGTDADVPHLRRFEAEDRRRETGQVVDANGLHRLVFFSSAQRAVMCRRR